MILTVELDRSQLGPDFTAGILTAPSTVEGLPDLVLATVERPWLNNAPHISCIPAGLYPMQYAWSDRWQRIMPFVMDVPFRDLIEVHVANVAADVEGCIGVGLRATTTGVGPSIPAFQRFDAWLGRASQHAHIVLKITDPPTKAVTA